MGYFRNLASAFIGKPMASSTSGFQGATGGRRLINVGGTTRGVSSLALSDGPMLTARVRKAVMDNPMAANGVNAFIAEVIGTGIRPHSKHPKPATRRKIEMEFGLWVAQSSAARRLGPGGKPDSLQNFFVQQMLVCRNVIEAGEAFGRLRPRLQADLSPTGLRVPLQIDLIEPEQLAFWRMTGDMASPNNLIRGGIEFDAIHQRVAYHFYREHPGDSTIWPNAYEVVRVPAESVLHVMEFSRGNQIRGITPLASIVLTMADVHDYDDAERLRQKLGAYMFGWRKTITPDDPQLNSTSTVGSDTAPAGAEYVEAKAGTLTMLDTNAGEEFGFYAHPGVANTYDVFMRNQHQAEAVVMRVAYEMLTGNMNQVNYSSARVRLLALRRVWEQFQFGVIVHQFCRPVWAAWLEAAALAGVIDAGDYRRNVDDYLAVDWMAQPWEWVDPVKDVASVQMELAACLTSREAEVSARGRDVEELDAEIARDHDREAKLGLEPVYGNMRVTETVDRGANEDEAAGEPVTGTQPAPGKTKPNGRVQ